MAAAKIKPIDNAIVKDNITSDHNKIAMRKIKHFGNSINHRITKGNYGIDTAKTKTINEICQKTRSEPPEALFISI